MGVARLSRDDARRIAIRAQMLDPHGTHDLGAVIDRLTFLQVDPTTSVVGRTTLLSPFDRLIDDRVRAMELFDFAYILEMYKPKANRRWGYFTLPVLHHDRLVGKVDATADHKTGRPQVRAVHHDVPFTRPMTAAVRAEPDALAQWLGLDGVNIA